MESQLISRITECVAKIERDLEADLITLNELGENAREEKRARRILEQRVAALENRDAAVMIQVRKGDHVMYRGITLFYSPCDMRLEVPADVDLDIR